MPNFILTFYVRILAAFCDKQTIFNAAACQRLYDTVVAVINALLGLVGGLSVLFLVIAGVRYISAAGNDEQIKKAKSTIIYAIIGLVIAIVSFVIVYAVNSALNPPAAAPIPPAK